jgi:hypothetical protein
VRTVDLRAEAAAEVRRLAAARAILRDGDDRAATRLEGSGAWIAISRRSRLRRALGPRICLLWRVVAEDASGRTVASRLVTVLVDLAPGARDAFPGSAAGRRARIRTLLREADGPVRAEIETACRDWQAAVMTAAGAFMAARLSREREIDARPAPPADASQPGLFDRRVERSRAADAAAAAESARAARARVRTMAADGSIAVRPAQLLLVLLA